MDLTGCSEFVTAKAIETMTARGEVTSETVQYITLSKPPMTGTKAAAPPDAMAPPSVPPAESIPVGKPIEMTKKHDLVSKDEDRGKRQKTAGPGLARQNSCVPGIQGSSCGGQPLRPGD